MLRKLRSNSGETIAEVLIASLVVLLGMLLYMMMVTTSVRIIESSDAMMKKIFATESALEGGIGTDQEETDAEVLVDGQGLQFSGISHQNKTIAIFAIFLDDDSTGIKKYIRATSE